MSTNNISEKQILSYLVSTFQYWGIYEISQQTFKQARKDKPQIIKQMKRLIFNLIFLHIFDFQYKITDCIDKKQQIKETQIDQIILAYLSECKCPFLLEMENDGVTFVGCNFQSSKALLLIAGWIMAVSDYFNQILNKVIKKRQYSIQNPRRNIQKYLQSTSKQAKTPGLISGSSQSQKISSLYKSLNAHQYSKQCLFKKKQKMLQKINLQLKKLNSSLSVYDLFSIKGQQQQIIREQKELKAILINQIENMKQRKYFWIWLDQKILKQTEIQTKNLNETFQKLQANHIKDTIQFKIDLQYLEKYMELCSYYQQKYQQLNQKLQSMKLVVKKSKQIAKQVSHDFKQTLQNSKYDHNKKHLFIALQLKNHFQIQNKELKNSEQKDEQKQNANVNQTKQKKKKLKKQLKQYLTSIQDAVKFI